MTNGAHAYVAASTAARLLGVDRRTVVAWIQRGTLPGTQEGSGSWFVFRIALAERLTAARNCA